MASGASAFSLAQNPKGRKKDFDVQLPSYVPSQRNLSRIPGTPFYHTPNEPADPLDCDRYPNSIYCTNFWEAIDRDQFLGYNTDLVLDECNIGVQIEPVLGYIRLPPTQIVYRHSPCPPPKKPYIPRDDYTSLPYVRDNGRPLIGYYSYSYAKIEVVGEEVENPYFEEGEIFVDLVETTEDSYPDKGGNNPNSIPNMKLTFTVSLRIEFNGTAAKATRISLDPSATPFEDIWREKGGTISGNPNDDDSYWRLDISGEIYQYISYPNMTRGVTEYSSSQIEINKHEFGDLLINRFQNLRMTGGLLFIASGKGYDSVSGFPYDFKETRTQDAFPFDGTLTEVIVDAQKTEWLSPGYIPEIPTPPRKRKDKDKMNCCKNNDQLLRLILKRIGPVPAAVPVSLVRANSGTRVINSLAEYIAYSVIQTNAQIGQFPQEINIQDADLTQEGDQSKKVSLPNLAESIAEIVGMLLVLQSESNANLIATVNAMVEAGNAKQLALLASDYGAANAEFLGYKGKQIEHKIPFTFKPGEQQLDKMLKAGEVKVKGWDNDDKNDLNDVIMPLLEMAAMFRAQNFRNVGTGNTIDKLKGILKGAVTLSDAADLLSKFIPPPDPEDPNPQVPEPKVDEWDAFINQVETGFIGQPGVSDPLNPYGRPLEQRPRIRDIGQDTSEDDD